MWMELNPEQYGSELQKEIQDLIMVTPQKKLSGVIAKLIIEMMHSVAVNHCSDDVIYEFEQDKQQKECTADEFYITAYGKVKDE